MGNIHRRVGISLEGTDTGLKSARWSGVKGLQETSIKLKATKTERVLAYPVAPVTLTLCFLS